MNVLVLCTVTTVMNCIFVCCWVDAVIVGKKEMLVIWIAAAMIWIGAKTHPMTVRKDHGESEGTENTESVLP